jgi:hypothetical protein
MSHHHEVAKLEKLRAVTVEHGATPAEAATAASLARRLIGQMAHRSGYGITVYTPRHYLAPGVYVSIG